MLAGSIVVPAAASARGAAQAVFGSSADEAMPSCEHSPPRLRQLPTLTPLWRPCGSARRGPKRPSQRPTQRTAGKCSGRAAMTSFAVTFFSDVLALAKQQASVTVETLATFIHDTTAARKDDLPLLKLGRFGNARTPKGSWRHDGNIIALTGVEGDYDAGSMSFESAVEIAEKAQVLSLLHTSPSHTTARPRWRILCPSSREFPAKERPQLLGRINGLYRGILGRESWTLSQAYYFGGVGNACRVEIVGEQPVDLLPELDLIAVGPPGSSPSHQPSEGAEARDDAELIRRILSGEGFHVELCAIAARYIGRGMDTHAVAETLRGMMLAQASRDARWLDRFRSIEGIVSSAAAKYAPEAVRRRAIARLTHRMARRRRSAEDIKTAILAQAQQLDLNAECALAIGSRILLEKARARG